VPRSRFQDGAEKSHYHDSLGVEGDITGEQTVRLLGPFSINHDSAGVNGDGTPLVTLEPGQLLLQVRGFVAEEFDDGGGDYTDGLQILVAPEDDLANSFTLTTFTGNIGDSSLGEFGPLSVDVDNPDHWCLVEDDPIVLLGFLGGTAVAGSLTVYALIAEPA